MAKQTQKTEPFNSDKLQALEQRLERVQGRLRAIRLSLDDQQAAELFLFNSPSMRLGLQNLERFSVAAEPALDALIRGTPYGPETTKAELDEHG
jgi:acetoin utilization deacetylase AcuC-like enzyme